MRTDMHKVVIERPRWNPGPGKEHRHANMDPDYLPRAESMRRRHYHRKLFTDLIGPLRRWVRSQVGRHWNDVYSEACAVIKPNSVVRVHIKGHLLELVHRDTFLRDGDVWCCVKSSIVNRGIERLIKDAVTRFSPFYVDPRTGVLCEFPVTTLSGAGCRRPRDESATAGPRWLGDARVLLCLKRLWFDCVLAPFPPGIVKRNQTVQDIALKRPINLGQAQGYYGREVYCVSKRQLSSRELRAYGIANSA